jgi:hypothetical protein
MSAHVFLSHASADTTQQQFRVIPVLLPGARRDSLPALLDSTTWVEFRT